MLWNSKMEDETGKQSVSCYDTIMENVYAAYRYLISRPKSGVLFCYQNDLDVVVHLSRLFA